MLSTISTLLASGREENKFFFKIEVCSKYFVQDCRYKLSFPKKSIAFSGAILWNEAPVSLKKAELLDSFKNKLKAYYNNKSDNFGKII